MRKRKNNKKQKVLKGMPDYLKKVENIALGKSIIDFLLINFPPICNYRCQKCFTWAHTREIKNPLTLGEYFSLLEEGKKWEAKVVGILGEGEPLCYKNAKEVIAYIDKLKMIPYVSTNGSLLSKEVVDFLFKHNTTIVISLDTLDEKKYNEFCGVEANLSNLLKNIAYARKLYSQRIYEKNGYKVHQLALHMTVTAENYKNIPEIMDFCGNDIYFDCQPLAKVGDAILHPSLIGDESIYKYYREASYIMSRPMVLTKTENNKDACCLFYYGVAIGYEGEVMLDTHAIATKHAIGNIRETPLLELIEKAKHMRDLFLEKYGTYYCPVRDNRYQEFLGFLKNKNSQRDYGFKRK